MWPPGLPVSHVWRSRPLQCDHFFPVTILTIMLICNMILKRCNIPYPLFVQFHQLLRDLGRVEGQPEAGHVQLGEQVLQHLLDGQPAGGPVLSRGGHTVLQDGPSERGELHAWTQRKDNRRKTRSETRRNVPQESMLALEPSWR